MKSAPSWSKRCTYAYVGDAAFEDFGLCVVLCRQAPARSARSKNRRTGLRNLDERVGKSTSENQGQSSGRQENTRRICARRKRRIDLPHGPETFQPVHALRHEEQRRNGRGNFIGETP